MRKLLIISILIISPIIGFAQYNWDVGFHAGVANYLGELGGGAGTRRGFIADMKLSSTQQAMGGFVRYKFNQYLSAKVGLNWIRIDGNDNKCTNRGRRGRNLSFRNDLIELAATAQVFFYEMPDLGHTYRYRNDFKMYAFAGVAGFYSNPKAHYNDEWVALRPLETEGKKYSAINLAIPVGLGLFFTVDKRHRIGWEFDWRTTFTDYIDDASGDYASNEELGNDPTRIALANRRVELPADDPDVAKPENYGFNEKTGVGAKRGDPTHNDSYISTSFYYAYVIRGKSSLYKSKYGSIFRKSKSKKKRIRAKF